MASQWVGGDRAWGFLVVGAGDLPSNLDSKYDLAMLVSEDGVTANFIEDPELGKKRKHVTYFLAESKFVDITLEEKGGLDDAKWFTIADALTLNFYEDIMPLITKAIAKLAAEKEDAPVSGEKQKQGDTAAKPKRKKQNDKKL